MYLQRFFEVLKQVFLLPSMLLNVLGSFFTYIHSFSTSGDICDVYFDVLGLFFMYFRWILTFGDSSSFIFNVCRCLEMFIYFQRFSMSGDSCSLIFNVLQRLG